MGPEHTVLCSVTLLLPVKLKGSVAEGPGVEGDVAGWPRAGDETDMAAVGWVGQAAGG